MKISPSSFDSAPAPAVADQIQDPRHDRTSARSGRLDGSELRANLALTRSDAKATAETRRFPPPLAALIAFVGAIYGIAPFVLQARDADLPPSLFFDDFFYYVVIVRNTLDGYISSFDRLSVTNGYHPLWFLVLLAIGAILGTGFWFLVVVHLLVTLLCCVASAAAHRLLREEGFRGLPLETATVFVFIAALYVASGGMEVALAVPLILWSLVALRAWMATPTPARSFGMALIASAAILSRLDAALLYLLLGPLVIVRAWTSGEVAALLATARRPNVLAVAAGAMPLAAWAIASIAFTGSAMPVSAIAKQLAPFPAARWDHFALILTDGVPVSLFGYVVRILGWAWVIATIGFILRHRRGRPSTSLVEVAAMCFAPLHLGSFGLVSAWGLWPWYYYSLVVAAPYAVTRVLAATIGLLRRPIGIASKAGFAPLALLLAGFGVDTYGRWFIDARFNTLHTRQSRALANFAATHPGRYAIGDRAGVPAYFMSNPVLQLEGLVGSGEFLGHVRARHDLVDVLRTYRVDYYVRFGTIDRDGSCFVVSEPRTQQAGAKSPKMIGRFCSVPMYANTATANSAVLVFKVP